MAESKAESPVTLGRYVRAARERAGLSLRNLEAIAEIPRATLNRLELDQVDNPSPELLIRLADAVELDSNDLFAFVGYRPSDKLPSLAPYLRAKYRLTSQAAKQAHEVIQAILNRFDES